MGFIISLENGTSNRRSDIVDFFESSRIFGSLFVLSCESGEKRIVCEVKNINDGLDQISFVPLGDDDQFEFIEGDTIKLINEAGNISFSGSTLKVHNKSWMTLSFPKELRVINQRIEQRKKLESHQITGIPTLFYYGEDGIKILMSHKAEVLDLSSSGISMKVSGARLDGYYRDDIVEVMITEKYPFLTKVRGKVVYKSIANIFDEDNRFYRIGIKFDKSLNLSPLQ